jgi:hypothetical protein
MPRSFAAIKMDWMRPASFAKWYQSGGESHIGVVIKEVSRYSGKGDDDSGFSEATA